MKLYRYVIVYDEGSAPNYDSPCATLAICKPSLRRTASRGDAVLAFTGSTLGTTPHAIRWAGVVAESMTFAAYWADPRFDAKKPHASPTPDNIYKPDKHGVLVQERNPVHDQRSVARDVDGRNVLAFYQWWHFPHQSPELPDEFEEYRIYNPRQGHRVSEIDGSKWAALTRWLDANAIVAAAGSEGTGGCEPRKAARMATETSARARC